MRTNFRQFCLSAILMAASAAFAPNQTPQPKIDLQSTSSSLEENDPVKQGSKTWEGDLDSEALLAKSTFAIKPDDLITLAKETVTVKGTGTKDNGECLSPDFVFRAAFVETNREDFIKALDSFKLEDSFDIEPQFFGWTVDPLFPNRVWFMSRQEATHTNEFMGVKPDGKVLILPPQCHHIDFDEDGKVTEFGFYTADRAQGTTGGLGGAFAYFYGVGKPLPFPEGKPYKKSLRYRLASSIGGFLQRMSRK